MFYVSENNAVNAVYLGLLKVIFVIFQYVLVIIFFQFAASLIYEAVVKNFEIGTSDATAATGKLFAVYSGMVASLAFTYSRVKKYCSGHSRTSSLLKIGLVRCSAPAALIGALLGISVALIFEKYLTALYPPADDQISPSVRLFGGLPAGLMPFYLLCSIGVTPIVEEVFFRGFLYQLLSESSGKIVSALVVSTVFVLLHIQSLEYWVALVSLVLGSIVLLLLREKSGSLVPSILMHQFYNLGVAIWSV